MGHRLLISIFSAREPLFVGRAPEIETRARQLYGERTRPPVGEAVPAASRA